MLHKEYKKDTPDGYERSQFYQLYHDWIKKADPVMRFTHKAGEKMFVDFSGDKPWYQNPATGEKIEVELFVSVPGASSYIFTCGLPDQTVESFVTGNIRAFEYYGGCARCLILDNLKAGVTHACHYDPEINKTLASMAEHYHSAVIPTRVAKPRDKAKVENAVLQGQRRVLAALWNRTFFSLGELNEAILEEVENACKRALEIEAYNYRSVKSLLERGLENIVMAGENRTIVPEALVSMLLRRAQYGTSEALRYRLHPEKRKVFQAAPFPLVTLALVALSFLFLQRCFRQVPP